MLRTTLLAMVILATSLAFAVPTAPAAPADPGNTRCAAEIAIKSQGGWDVICGGESACGATTLCLRTIGRDVLGEFYVCRCDGGKMTSCCQLILRRSTNFPQAKGNCSDCGEAGLCVMDAIGPTTYKAVCRLGGVVQW